jgi:hypothetical protein
MYNTGGQGCHAKGSIKDTEEKSLCIEIKTIVECEMYDCTGNNYSHRNNNKDLNKTLEPVPRKPSIDLLQRQLFLKHHT